MVKFLYVLNRAASRLFFYQGVIVVMENLRESAVNRLLEIVSDSYNIKRDGFPDGAPRSLAAICECFIHTEKYFLTRKANLWSADSEEFLYVFGCGDLSADDVRSCIDFVKTDGLSKAHIGPGHMYTYLTAAFICGQCGDDALRAAERADFYKSFRLSFHGWAELHVGLTELEGGMRSAANKRGRELKKLLNADTLMRRA